MFVFFFSLEIKVKRIIDESKLYFFVLRNFYYFGSDMLLSALFTFRCKPVGEFIKFLQDRGLITRNYDCPKCGKAMVLGFNRSISDQYRWRCFKCKMTRSIRLGSWFHNSKLSLVDILLLTYF